MMDAFSLHRGTRLPAMRGHGRAVRCLCVSADGRTVVSAAGNDNEQAELLVWEAVTGGLRQALASPGVAVTAVAANPAGEEVASASRDGKVKVWDLSTGKQRIGMDGTGGPWRVLTYSGDGKVLAAGGGANRAGVIGLWEVQSGLKLKRLAVGRSVAGLALSPDGRRLAYSGKGGVVRLLEVQSDEPGITLDTGMKEIAHLAFSPDGKTLAVAGTSTGVKLWDVPSGQERASLPGHEGGAYFAGFAPDGKMLLTAAVRGEARLWYCVQPDH
jgi:WD40 repeat protein